MPEEGPGSRAGPLLLFGSAAQEAMNAANLATPSII